jgi:sugar (pentulose or hexulose) kinase
MALLGIDVGTTHCKAALYQEDGTVLLIESQPTPTRAAQDGRTVYDPDQLWGTISSLVRSGLSKPGGPPIQAVGIASMAESGLLIDASGSPISPMIPWFDPSSTPQAARMARQADARTRFLRSGLRQSFKCSLAKILWLRDAGLVIPDGATWLCAADYIAFRFTGKMGTDPSLAGRTGAFWLAEKTWDGDWLAEFGLRPDLFPPVRPSGSILGSVTGAAARETGLIQGTPVAVCGHDHICGAFGAGAVQPGETLDSMGTAEALVGAMDERQLGEREYQSGLSYGMHTAPGRMYWNGGLSTSGGALDWLRRTISAPEMTYTELEDLAEKMTFEPGNLLFFPYLAGSGSPHSNSAVRGAWVGLDFQSGRADLLKAVLEGTAFEAEWIHREGAAAARTAITQIAAIGGGTRLRRWMQIKADISGCTYSVLGNGEATLSGAAILAGIGAGLFTSPVEALAAWKYPVEQCYAPDEARHRRYADLFERRYLAFQQPLRGFFDDQPSQTAE